MKKYLIIALLLTRLFAITGYLHQHEISDCQDACSQYAIHHEVEDNTPINVIFQNTSINIDLYINRFVEVDLGQEITCVECTAFEVLEIDLSEDCWFPVSCFVDPCEVAAECQLNTPVECISNYCGGCYADFYDLEGNLVNCNSLDCEDPNPAGCFQNGCPESYECIDDWENSCTASQCFCDEELGDWVCTEDCNGGTCFLMQELGDIDNDGIINVLDLVLLIGFILQTDFPSDSEIFIADYNEDNELNILDVVGIITVILNPEDSIQINSGTSYGECSGYCIQNLDIDNGFALFIASGWDWSSGELPDLTIEDDLSEDAWQNLVSLVDFNYFLSLDDVYGCPDCADGGAESIEIIYNGVSKEVIFDAYSEVEGIEELTLSLRAYREYYWNQIYEDQLSEECYLEPNPGPCMAAVPAYYYDFTTNSCMLFIWGGCEGVVPFETFLECQNTCE